MIVPLLCFFFVALVKAFSTTHVVYPLGDQLPLVARVNQTWSWTFSEHTFNTTDDGPIVYSTPYLPSWLSFNPATRTFSGTPAPDDEGNPRVTVVATTPHSSASSSVTLCVTHYTPPSLTIPISDQFNPSNRALSSVFTISPGSALATLDPGLRIPTGPWSFSIGFEGRTFTSQSDLFYAARRVDGSDLPYWMVFNTDDITLDGVVPPDAGLAGPETYALVLVASDQEGYTADTLPFHIIIASHELSAISQELPTINVTAGSTFTASLLSPADFTGLYVDGGPLQPSNITQLTIDTRGYGWLRYDAASRTISGAPAINLSNTRYTLSANITTWFNQNIQTTVSIQLVPSYFTAGEFPALHLSPGEHFNLDLDQYYSNSTAGRHGDADLSLSFEPSEAGNFIALDSAGNTLSGTIPDDFVSDHITATFTAYSQITHSTSHANLIMFINTTLGGRNGAVPHPTGLSVEAHRRMILGLAITFGILGGLCLVACFFAWFRRFVRVEDSVVSEEEGRLAWTKQERRYYGLDLNSEKSSIESPQPTRYPQVPPVSNDISGSNSFGHDLQRVTERTHSGNEGSEMDSTMISKREFIQKVKQTVRSVSNKYNNRLGKPQPSPPRPTIGRPILLRPSGFLDSTIVMGNTPTRVSPSNPFDDIQSQRTSTIMSGSPSTSTAEHSIPRRRADFAPPRSMAQVHFEDGHLVRRPSNMSMGSDSRLDVASRHTSVRSARSTSHLSHEYFPDAAEVTTSTPVRPRLVPFTSSTRVPVPRVSSMPATEPSNGELPTSKVTKSRIASQRAKVIKPPGSPTPDSGGGVRKSNSGDDLTMGLHYVQSLGVDSSPVMEEISPSKVTRQEVTRYVVRTGEKFQIRVQIPVTAKRLQVKQVSGQDLPRYLNADVNGVKGMVEFTGTALSRDLGMLTIGVYVEKECVSKVILEVIPRR